VAFSEGKYSAF